jgi:hypothetical protein
MKEYDWVIFCGWNTMTKEIFETLKEYVKGGGKLLITAAHIRDSIERDKRGEFIDADLESFFGAKIKNEIMRTNDGFKFDRNSIVPGMLYPGTTSFMCDPCWSAGYTDYVSVEPTGAHVAAYLADSFAPSAERQWPAVIENKYGEGNVIFMANSEYPGAPEVYPLYKMMVKNILAASHRTSDLKVIGSDKLRFAMYEGDDKYKLYVFNSDFNFEQKAKVVFRGEEREAVVSSVGLEIMEFKK